MRSQGSAASRLSSKCLGLSCRRPPCAALPTHSSPNGRGSEKFAWGGKAEEACPAAPVAQQLARSPQGVYGRRQGGCSALAGARLQSERTAGSGRQLPPSAPLEPRASPWSSKLQHFVNLPHHWAGVSATERHTIHCDSQQDLERRRGACRRPSDAGVWGWRGDHTVAGT